MKERLETTRTVPEGRGDCYNDCSDVERGIDTSATVSGGRRYLRNLFLLAAMTLAFMSANSQEVRRRTTSQEKKKNISNHVLTSKILNLEDLSSWSTFPRETQFTDHILDLLYFHSLAKENSEECDTQIHLSIAKPFQVPTVTCPEERKKGFNTSPDLSLMKHIFANRTIPYNVTFGFDYGDSMRREKFMNTQCWGNSDVGGHTSVVNMQDRHEMANYDGGLDNISHIEYVPRFNATAVPWEKRSPLPIWRGTLWRWERSRLPITEYKRWAPVNFSFSHPDLLDARFSGIDKAVDVELIDRASKEALHLTSIDRIESSKYFQEHQTALVMVGIGAAFRTSKHLMTKTAVILQEVELQEWYTKYLQPYVHYIPVKEDLSDLKEILWWVKEHPAEVKAIGERGYEFWKTHLTFNRNEEHFYELVYRLSEFQHWQNLIGEELQVVSQKHLPKNDTAREPRPVPIVEDRIVKHTSVDNIRDHKGLRSNSSSSLLVQQWPTSESELIILPQERGAIDGVQRLCEKLWQVANGTANGEEPWRKSTKEWMFQLPNCGNQGESILGNHLSRWYAARTIAAGAGISIEQTCDSPVIHGIPQEVTSRQTHTDEEYSWRDTCERCVGKSIESHQDVHKNQDGCYYGHAVQRGLTSPLEYAVPTIQSDLRSLAAKVLERQPQLELDEVTIHIRVGDIARQKHDLYGLVPFQSFADLIPPSAKRIGIVCAPFRQKRSNWGFGDADLNEAVVVSTRDYLQSAFPGASITIRNSKTEAFDTVFARMILSNRTICGSSTFCLYPALASVGESFILHSTLYGGDDSWLAAIDEKFPLIHYTKKAFIYSTEIYDKNVTDIIKLLNTTSDDDEKEQYS